MGLGSVVFRLGHTDLSIQFRGFRHIVAELLRDIAMWSLFKVWCRAWERRGPRQIRTPSLKLGRDMLPFKSALCWPVRLVSLAPMLENIRGVSGQSIMCLSAMLISPAARCH